MTLRSDTRRPGVSARVSDLFRHPSSVLPSALTNQKYYSEVIADSPILYLRLDETSGTSCEDFSGNGRTGTTHGTVTRNVAGHAGLGKGVTFGGTTSDWISVPDEAALDLTGDFTYECWFSYSGTAGGILMSKGQQDGSNAGYELWLGGTGGRHVHMDRARLTVLFRTTGSVSSDSLWHHIVCTRTTNTYRIYVDGSLFETSGTVATAVQATDRDFTMGSDYAGGSIGGTNFPGSLDEVAVYSTALSSTRIAAHYAAAV